MMALKGFLSFATCIVVLVLCTSQVQSAKNSHYVPATPELEEKIELQKTTFHWLPYRRVMYRENEEGNIDVFCQPPGSSIEEFPQIFTKEQRLQGWITLHFILAIYLFILLAFICDKSFLPTVERLCEVLKISPDVAATTFMATATTMPEFFNNTISVFLAESDMGLGAIIGSMLFNTLGVSAAACLFTKKPIQIDWWPITRDSILLIINIIVLVVFAWDGAIMWWETCILVTIYVLYWILMFQNPRIMKNVKYLIEDKFMWCQRIKNYDIINQRPRDEKPANDPTSENGDVISENGEVTKRQNGNSVNPQNGDAKRPQNGIAKNPQNGAGNRESYKAYHNQGFEGNPDEIGRIEAMNHRKDRRQSFDMSRIDEIEVELGLFEYPRGVGKFDVFWFFFTWPIRFLLHYTIPNPIKYKKWFVVSFIMCIIWIGVVSYVIFWMIVVIGDTFGIPEPIMGFTLLAFGGCMPEAISAVIVARSGSGEMGVSNALGANCLAVVFSLGLPWFIRTMVDGAGFTGAFINITSDGMEYVIMGLIVAVVILYIVIAAVGYKLRKTIGGILAASYLILATLAVLFELDIIFSRPGGDC